MAASPSFIGTPRAASVSLSAANTARNGSGTIVQLIAGVASGTRVLEVRAKAADTMSGGVVNLFLSTDSGVTWRLLGDLQVLAETADDVTQSWEDVLLFDNLVLAGSGHRLGVTSTIAQPINVFAFGGDL